METATATITPASRETIMEHLGGAKAFFMMGTNKFVDVPLGILFNIKGCRTINHISVEYDVALDMYNITYYKFANLDLKKLDEDKAVFCGDLKIYIEQKTGLKLSLKP